MSYATLHRQQADPAFTDRVTAAVMQEAWQNPELGATAYGLALRDSPSNATTMFWPVSIATAEAYAYAVASGNPDPGGDPSVVTDADLTAAVQANWPPDEGGTP